MRLIDADQFILAIMDASLSSVDEDTILDLVDSVPTVDAAPVVRCKDCENAYNNSSAIASGIFYCSTNMRAMLEDDFCSYGERRGGDESNV